MYKLIIIDDEEKILDGLADLFPWKDTGFEVVKKFTSAEKALTYIDREPVDVVMTDICMPDMTGLELTAKLKAYPQIRVVLFSSYQNYEYMRAAIQYNITDYLLKPINYNELITCFEKIRIALDETRAQPEDKPKTYYEDTVRKVDEYIECSYQKASLQEAAEIVGLSPNYLSKIYKEKAGTGFLEKLNKVRMEKSCELLLKSEYKTYEVAYFVGYDNPKNFARAFKSYYHVSPRDYKNGIRAEAEDGT